MTILLFFGSVETIQAQQNDIKFDHVLNIGDIVRFGTIIQDSDGFFWIPTQSALVRYDGYDLKHYHKAEDNPISDNVVNTIYEDSRGILWVGTFGGGLNRYDKETDTFTHYLHDPGNSNSLSNNVPLYSHR